VGSAPLRRPFLERLQTAQIKIAYILDVVDQCNARWAKLPGSTTDVVQKFGTVNRDVLESTWDVQKIY
jgi:hypothetical protein